MPTQFNKVPLVDLVRKTHLIKQASLEGLLESTFLDKAASDGKSYSDETGFHLYASLNLTLELTAAADMPKSREYLKHIQNYVSLAEKTIKNSAPDMQVLEVQGEKIHFFLPTATVDLNTLKEIISFSVGLTQMVYKKFESVNGFNGFKMATDHGRAIMISAGFKGDSSLVSLGPVANNPAKQLQGTTAGYLTLPTRILKKVDVTIPGDWHGINVKEPADYIKQIRDFTLEASMESFSDSYTLGGYTLIKKAAEVDESHGVKNPKKVQGFCLRADLDGFTNEVAEAFAHNDDDAIQRLVAKFAGFMDFSEEYHKAIQAAGHEVYQLPWAGDCATFVIVSNDYEESRKDIPVTAARTWHNQKRNRIQASWYAQLKDGKWAVGVAGGGKEETNGYILLAHLASEERQFLLSSGWATGRSEHACAADVDGGQTSLPKVDFQALSDDNKEKFEPHGLFFIANDLGKADNEISALSNVSGVAYSSDKSRLTVSPQPYSPKSLRNYKK